MDEIRLALIGTGQNMVGHIKSLVNIDDVRIVGLADVDEENLAKAADGIEHDVPTFTDYRKLLDDVEADACFIAVPNYLHRQVTCDCLDAGLHTMCEKPMATSPEDCDAMIAAAERNGRILEVGLSCRFSRIDGQAHEMVAGGVVGEPKMIWCREFRAPFAKKYQDWILDSSRSGGTLLEKTCHHFDLFNWFANADANQVYASGAPDWVYRDAGAHAERKDEGAKVDIIDNAFVTVDYDNGMRANLGLCMFAQRGRTLEFGVQGTEGALVYYRTKFRIEVFDEENPVEGREIEIEIPEHEKSWSHHGQAYREQLYFFDCVRNGTKPSVDGYVGKRAVEISLAAEQSIRERAAVALTPTPLP